MSVTEPSPVRAPVFPWTGLLVLAAAVFLSITSEMLPTGLLPEMSADLGVGAAPIGLLVTVFAFTVVITSTSLVALTKRIPRHALLVVVIAVLGLANALTAIAPDYATVVATRVLGGLAHGLFWSIVGAYAGHLVPPKQIARAVAVTTAGGTLAFVLGVPLATAAGQVIGWRPTFGAVAALMIVGALLVWRLLPAVGRTDGAHIPAASTDAASTDAALADRARRDPTIPAVVLVCLVTAFTMVGHYALYTYVVPVLTDMIGAPAPAVGPLLFVYGTAGAVGLVLAGSLLGRRPTRGLFLALLVTVLAVLGLTVFAGQLGPSLAVFVIWGVAFGALPPLLQTRMLHSASARIRDAASAFYTTAFNLGIGGGALVGAVLYETVGLQALPLAYAVMLVVAMIALVAGSLRARSRRAP